LEAKRGLGAEEKTSRTRNIHSKAFTPGLTPGVLCRFLDKGVETEMEIEWITHEEADRAGTQDEQVLIEQTPDHYPEFNAFLQRELEHAGGNLFFRGISGMVYRVGTVKEKTEGFRGIEICLRSTGREDQMISGDIVDRDLWGFLEWLVGKVGMEWTLEALRKTGAIYRIPGAPQRV
jgi:hypothetical protein